MANVQMPVSLLPHSLSEVVIEPIQAHKAIDKFGLKSMPTVEVKPIEDSDVESVSCDEEYEPAVVQTSYAQQQQYTEMEARLQSAIKESAVLREKLQKAERDAQSAKSSEQRMSHQRYQAQQNEIKAVREKKELASQLKKATAVANNTEDENSFKLMLAEAQRQVALAKDELALIAQKLAEAEAARDALLLNDDEDEESEGTLQIMLSEAHRQVALARDEQILTAEKLKEAEAARDTLLDEEQRNEQALQSKLREARTQLAQTKEERERVARQIRAVMSPY